MNIPVVDCWRCGNALTHKEIKAGSVYCNPCAKIRADEKHRKELEASLHNANKKAMR